MSYEIGISGISAAQKALDIIGNNIANAATEGYHRQKINLVPAYASQTGPVLRGGGVDVASVTRMIDNLLEQEILRQRSLLEHVRCESGTLRIVENALGELSDDGRGLSAAIDKFFNTLGDLSGHPGQLTWQNQVISAADTMAGQFRTLGEFLTTLENQIRLETENTIEQINALINRIAELNDNVERMEIGGGQANNLRDQRDQCITELGELIGVQTQNREYGVVDVSVGGIPVVTSALVTELEVGLKEDGSLGITAAGEYNYNTEVQGGRLGGLLSLKNDILADIHNDLDDLAGAIIQQINQYHVQGVGSEGSFSQLTGWSNTSGDWSDFSSVSAGYMYIRVTDTSTLNITRTLITIDPNDPDHDSISDLATDISAITGVNASVDSSTNKLTITAADTNFDFLPAVLPEPTASDLNGTSPPVIAVSGIYTGTANSTFTCTVVGGVDDEIGVTDGLKLEVSKDGEFIKELNVGLGYAEGDTLDLGDGLYISLSIDEGKTAGNLNNEDSFEIKAWANTDTSGVLAAVGLNTFFSGSSATNMAVCSDISNSPGRVATALGAEMTDNTNVLRMAGAKDEAISDLNAMTAGEFYRQMVTNIGQQISITQMRQDNIEIMVQNLGNQQSDISGVNINDEAAQMLVFEQMFQAMAKYLNTVQSSILTIMELI